MGREFQSLLVKEMKEQILTNSCIYKVKLSRKPCEVRLLEGTTRHTVTKCKGAADDDKKYIVMMNVRIKAFS